MKKRHAESHPPQEKTEAGIEVPAPGSPGAPAGAAPPAPPEAGEAETVSREIEALKDQLLRLRADFDNYRKRAARERQEHSVRAAENLLRELLPVLDHFELGLNTARERQADPAVVGGFQLIYDQLFGVLQQAGLTPVEAEGRVFDPHLHEAVSHEPADTVPADHVLRQRRRGYTLGGRLLRAAQVVVSRGPEAAPEAPAEEGPFVGDEESQAE